MIPLKIQIKNFLSYGDTLQTIDFSPYHLVCLSGKNGHGKSALLDAITWAIWGQARKVGGTAKADQGLLRLGQTHMLVTLDFECNNIQYRIRREFALTYGKPYTALDFGIVQADTETIVPLTEKTIRATQVKIEHTINLDFDSFINSAFLRQGQANEFSKKSPKDRKEILANILGLQHYEQLKKLASDTARDKMAQKQQLTALQAKIETELATYDQTSAQITATKQAFHVHLDQEKNLIATQQKLQQQHSNIITLKLEQQQVNKDMNALEQDNIELTKTLRQLVTQWRTAHKERLHLASIQALATEKDTLYRNLEQIQKQLQEKLMYQEQYLKAQQTLVIIQQRLQQEQMISLQQKKMQVQYAQLHYKGLQQQLATCQQQYQQLDKELNQITLTITHLEKIIKTGQQVDIIKCEQFFEKRRIHYQQWIVQANYIKHESDQIEQKKSLVNDLDSPSCPLCEQNLSATRKKFLKHKLVKNEQTLAHRYQRLKTLITRMKQLLIDQHQQVTSLKQQQQALLLEQQKIEQLKQQSHELAIKKDHLLQQEITIKQDCFQYELLIKKSEQELALEEKNATHHMAENPQYKQQATELEIIKKTYESITYNQHEHALLQERLNVIEKQLTLHSNLNQNTALQDERKNQIAVLCQKIKHVRDKVHTCKQRIKELSIITELEKQYLHEESELKTARSAWTQQHTSFLQEIAKLEQQLTYLDRLQKEHTTQQKELATLSQEIKDYQEIATALGKNGIQALLIEDAIPEIETAANELLSKLTDNQATMLIESLRDLKSGGTKETLDIKIADAIGIRPYEMFSGGEAFRIDFSLRIAISKLLARRSGTSLQTLIIDEGFGSQDEEGLSYIMDALYKIQDDFKKIIIVSHLPRLKDQFPVHFYIQKNPQGSSVHIMEQA